MTRLLPLALLALLAVPASGQDATALVERGRALVAAGHVSNSADSLMAARAVLGVAAQSDDAETAVWAAYYTALAEYRLAYAFWGEEAERALGHAEQGTALIAPVAGDRALPDGLRAEAHALHAALLNAQMGLDPTRAMALGAAAGGATAASLRLAPDNPRVLFQSGSSLLNTPEEWGGDPAEAVRQLTAATERFASPSASGLAPTWGEDEAYAWLGMAHLMAGDAQAARPAIERAEALNPASPFVQYKLKPWLAQLADPTSAQ